MFQALSHSPGRTNSQEPAGEVSQKAARIGCPVTLAAHILRQTGEISLERLKDLMYLCDWRAALTHQASSSVGWRKALGSAESPEIRHIVERNRDLFVLDCGMVRNRGLLMSLRLFRRLRTATEIQRETAAFILKKTLGFTDFQVSHLARSTMPVYRNESHTPLDLVHEARIYRGHEKVIRPL
jgi:hypothetical protein